MRSLAHSETWMFMPKPEAKGNRKKMSISERSTCSFHCWTRIQSQGYTLTARKLKIRLLAVAFCSKISVLFPQSYHIQGVTSKYCRPWVHTHSTAVYSSNIQQHTYEVENSYKGYHSFNEKNTANLNGEKSRWGKIKKKFGNWILDHGRVCLCVRVCVVCVCAWEEALSSAVFSGGRGNKKSRRSLSEFLQRKPKQKRCRCRRAKCGLVWPSLTWRHSVEDGREGSREEERRSRDWNGETDRQRKGERRETDEERKRTKR